MTCAVAESALSWQWQRTERRNAALAGANPCIEEDQQTKSQTEREEASIRPSKSAVTNVQQKQLEKSVVTCSYWRSNIVRQLYN